MQSDTVQSITRQIDDQGYAIVPALIDPTVVAEIRDQLAPWLQQHHWGRNDFEGHRTERVYALLAKANAIAKLVEHDTVLAALDQLLEPSRYLLSACLAINVHPGETPQRFHTDDSSVSILNYVNANAAPADQTVPRRWVGISTIWALDDFTADNGATELVPGSHRWASPRAPRADEIVKAEMPAGSCLFLAGTLRHRGGANNSNATRLGITPQYCAPFMRQLENMTLAVPPETAASYSDRVQALLGYSVADPGFMGHVDGLHPKRLVNAGYQGRKARGQAS